jgi:hypothetical protein
MMAGMYDPEVTIARKLTKSVVKIFYWSPESYNIEYTSALTIVKGISLFVGVEGVLV